MNQIEVSVVLSVFNEEDSLEQTLQSILTQRGVHLELIVVDDGSTDKSGEILSRYAKSDDRIKLISQKNSGITDALINGCKRARGTFIARQDAGDRSLSGRLKKQVDCLKARPDAVLCSTGTRYFSERGESLIEASLSANEVNTGLQPASLAEMVGPTHHGCTMFRRDAYIKCGGYRSAFIVAQDLDLWTRLADLGEHVALEEIYYEATLRKTAISSRRRQLQEITRQHIFECIQLRKNTGTDAAYVDRLKEVLIESSRKKINSALNYHYFVGSILLKNKPQQSRYYFKQVLRGQPWHLKSWIKLLRAYLT